MSHGAAKLCRFQGQGYAKVNSVSQIKVQKSLITLANYGSFAPLPRLPAIGFETIIES